MPIYLNVVLPLVITLLLLLLLLLRLLFLALLLFLLLLFLLLLLFIFIFWLHHYPYKCSIITLGVLSFGLWSVPGFLTINLVRGPGQQLH